MFISQNPNQNKNNSEEGASVKLDLIKLKNWDIKYIDHSARVLIDAKGLNYTGKRRFKQ